MGTFVSYFFSGFILGKIPFPLSPSFRLMLQVRLSLLQSEWFLTVSAPAVALLSGHQCSSALTTTEPPCQLRLRVLLVPSQDPLVSPYITHFMALSFCILLLSGLRGMSML